MDATIKGMQIQGTLYLFKDAVARATTADLNTKIAITQDDIDEVCVTTEQAEVVTSTGTEDGV